MVNTPARVGAAVHLKAHDNKCTLFRTCKESCSSEVLIDIPAASRSTDVDKTGETLLKVAIAGKGFEDNGDDVLSLLDNFGIDGEEFLGEFRVLNSVYFGTLLQVAGA